MFENLFEVKREPSLGLYAVGPVQPGSHPYLVVFASETEAKMFCVRLTLGQVESPSKAPQSYLAKGCLKDGVTHIYHLK